MRRFERALCICIGVAAVPFCSKLVQFGYAPAWAAQAPILAALAIISVVGNVSAVARLRLVAAEAHSGGRTAPRARGVSPAVRAP
jgi:hypothetical protein